MRDSTREDGTDDEPNIIDLSEYKAKKESAETRDGEVPNDDNPAEAAPDPITTDSAITRARAMNVIRLKLKSNSGGMRIPKSGLPNITASGAKKKKKKKQMKYLAESSTTKFDGLNPIKHAPIKSIVRGVITEKQPQVLAYRDAHIRQRGQVKLYSVYLLNQETIDDSGRQASADEATNELLAISARLKSDDIESDQRQDGDANIFDEIALILLKLTGTNFNGLLNDQRVKSVCFMIQRDDTKAKIRHQLEFMLKNPV